MNLNNSQLPFSKKWVGKKKIKEKLRSEFLVPPFSILDTRRGYWQKRRNAWLSLGIRSETGRSVNQEYLKKSAGRYYKEGVPVISGGSSGPRAASVFDPVLCELIYKWFGFKEAKVLDPFAGGSVRGIVAEHLGLDYTGIDLSGDQLEANRKQAKKIGVSPKWIEGDSANIKKLVKGKFDLLFSCPPYYDLEIYGNKEGELSAMSTYRDFRKAYFDIIEKSVSMLDYERFACFVIGNIRDKKGYYRNLVGDTIEGFNKTGMKLYNDIVLINSVGSLAIRVGKQFRGYRKVGKCHQNVLVFYEGNPTRIKKIFGKIKT